MDYKERKFTVGGGELTFRGAGWQGCLNILPYLDNPGYGMHGSEVLMSHSPLQPLQPP
jgi:hypothetical protein